MPTVIFCDIQKFHDCKIILPFTKHHPHSIMNMNHIQIVKLPLYVICKSEYLIKRVFFNENVHLYKTLKLLVTGIHMITMEQFLFNSLVIYNENLENSFQITRQNLMSLD